MSKPKTDKPTPHRSGYAEQQPVPNKKHQKEPDENTPHEAQNVPANKPKPASG